MRKIRSLLLLSIVSILLLTGGCANAPEGDITERESAPASSTQSIGSSEPEKVDEEPLMLEDSTTGEGPRGVVPSAEMLHKKSEPQSDDMERLD